MSNTTHAFTHPIIGQEAVCPDGLGRVTAFRDDFPNQWIEVSTYAKDRSCQWAPHNVQLVPIQTGHVDLGEFKRLAHAKPRLTELEGKLLAAVRVCLKAERGRKKKLLPGAPATTYTQARIDMLEAVIEEAEGDQL